MKTLKSALNVDSLCDLRDTLGEQKDAGKKGTCVSGRLEAATTGAYLSA